MGSQFDQKKMIAREPREAIAPLLPCAARVRGLFLVKPFGRIVPGRLLRYDGGSISPDIDPPSRLASDPGTIRCEPI